MQVTGLAMSQRLDTVCDALQSLVAPTGILLRGAERGLSKLEGLHLPDRLVRGTAPTGPIFVMEHGLKFGVDLTEGQKTGFYLDQPRQPTGGRAVCVVGGCSTCSVTQAASAWPVPCPAGRGACWPLIRVPRRRPWRRPTLI